MLKIQGLANASSQNEKLRQKLAAIEGVDEYNVDDLGLDFTVPGYDIELKVRLMLFPVCALAYVLLKPGGRDIAVTTDNVNEYIREVIDAIIEKVALAQVHECREDFSKVFPISDLQELTADELVMLVNRLKIGASRVCSPPFLARIKSSLPLPRTTTCVAS